MGGMNIPINYCVEDLPRSAEALTRFYPEREEIEIVLSESTYNALECDHPRARFSLCHEIGHAVLHPAELIRISRFSMQELALFRQHQKPPPVYRDAEWQAEALAGALLMPADGLEYLRNRNGSLSASIVQNHFKVSLAAATSRLRVFGQRRSELIF